jgi:hypothetical protein
LHSHASGDAAAIAGALLHVKTLSGPITLTDIHDSHLDIHTLSGNINIHNVTGAFVEVSSGSGRITYDGDPGSAGYYRLTSHTGDLDVSIPASASVEIKARSLQGESDQHASSVDGVPVTDQRNLFVKPGIGPSGKPRSVLPQQHPRIVTCPTTRRLVLGGQSLCAPTLLVQSAIRPPL